MGMQQWRLNAHDSTPTAGIYEGTLLYKLEQYVVNGGTCPLDYLAIKPEYWDVGMRRQTSEVSQDFVDDPDNFGDDTIYVVYRIRSGKAPDMEEDESDHGLDSGAENSDDELPQIP